jgi:hypothetical protein
VASMSFLNSPDNSGFKPGRPNLPSLRISNLTGNLCK